MKLHPLIYLISLLTFNVLAKVEIYDLVKQGRNLEVGISKRCAEEILNLPRSFYHWSDLSERTVAMRDLKLGEYFYHYTTDVRIPSILHENDVDRTYTQTRIHSEQGYAEIMKKGIDIQGIAIANGGIYVAGNPFSSMSYGSIQIRYRLNLDARVYVDETKTLDFRSIRMDFTERLKSLPLGILKECRKTQLGPLILQESGVDAHFYIGQGLDWMVIVNDDIIEGSSVLRGVKNNLSYAEALTNSNKLGEISDKDLKHIFTSYEWDSNFYRLKKKTMEALFVEAKARGPVFFNSIKNSALVRVLNKKTEIRNKPDSVLNHHSSRT